MLYVEPCTIFLPQQFQGIKLKANCWSNPTQQLSIKYAVKDLFWFTVQITQFQKSLISGFLVIEIDSHTHCEYTECIFGMKMLFMVGGGPFQDWGDRWPNY